MKKLNAEQIAALVSLTRGAESDEKAAELFAGKLAEFSPPSAGNRGRKPLKENEELQRWVNLAIQDLAASNRKINASSVGNQTFLRMLLDAQQNATPDSPVLATNFPQASVIAQKLKKGSLLMAVPATAPPVVEPEPEVPVQTVVVSEGIPTTVKASNGKKASAKHRKAGAHA